VVEETGDLAPKLSGFGAADGREHRHRRARWLGHAAHEQQERNCHPAAPSRLA
jgi:hypothetical protein